MQYYLSSFHGGVLTYNAKEGIIEVKEYNINNENLIYSDGSIFFYEKDIRVEIFYDYLNKKITTNKKDQKIYIKKTDFFVTIIVNNLFLCSTPKMKIEMDRKSESLWERFQLINKSDLEKLYANNFFDKDKISFNESEIRKDIPNIVWCYWEQDDPPKLVEKCLERLKELNKDFKIIFLNKKNIDKYLDISYIYDKDITPTMRSDIIRLKLLYEYGGIWSDASIIYNLPIKNIINFENNRNDITAFYLKSHFNSALQNKYPVVENWFIAAIPKSKMIKNWLNEILKVLDIGVDGLLKIYKERDDYDIIKNTFSNEIYFISYLALTASFIDNENDISLSLYCADHSALYYHHEHGWANPDRFTKISTLKKEELNYLPKLIKLTRTDRTLLTNSRLMKASYMSKIIN